MNYLRFSLFTIFALMLLARADAAGLAIRGGLVKEVTEQPGGVFDSKIQVENTSDEPIEAKMSLSDYRHTADGASYYEAVGTNPRSNAAWITVTPKQVTIPAHTIVTVNAHGVVPTDLKLAGTYWCMLMVEPANVTPPSAKELKQGETRATVQTIVRYGIHLITHIGDTGTRAISFLDRRIVSSPKSRLLQVDIANTGERFLTPTMWVELLDAEGRGQGRITGESFRVYPGNSTRRNIDITALAPGEYTGILVVDNRDDNVFGTQIALNVEALPPATDNPKPSP